MAVIRLYKKIYRINSTLDAGDLYSLINVYSINATSFLRNSPTVIENNIPVTQESDGIYYADLSPIFYSYDNEYDLKWTVQYIGNSPQKILTTTFKINPNNIIGAGGEIYTEINNREIYTEIDPQIIEVIIL